jgi:hypothetical protein
MARGSKTSYTSKQRRMASHIEDSEKKTGRSSKRAAAIAYATVNKKDGGGKGAAGNKSGSGRKKASNGRKRASTTRKKSSSRKAR